MHKRSHRSERVAYLIQRELAQLMQQEAADPRFRALTITAVSVSRDLSVAKVYFVLLVPEREVSGQEKKEVVRALKQAEGFFRTLLAPRLQLRVVPELVFIYDESIHTARHLASILENLPINDET